MDQDHPTRTAVVGRDRVPTILSRTWPRAGCHQSGLRTLLPSVCFPCLECFSFARGHQLGEGGPGGCLQERLTGLRSALSPQTSSCRQTALASLTGLEPRLTLTSYRWRLKRCQMCSCLPSQGPRLQDWRSWLNHAKTPTCGSPQPKTTGTSVTKKGQCL